MPITFCLFYIFLLIAYCRFSIAPFLKIYSLFKRYAPEITNTLGRERGQLIVILHTPDGQQFEFSHVPWSGYFDRFETVYTSEVQVQRLH